MATNHKIRVWVRTSAIKSAKAGSKIDHDNASGFQNRSFRAIDSSSSTESDENDWGWSLATIVEEKTKEVTLLIHDDDSPYNLQKFDVPRVCGDNKTGGVDDNKTPYVAANLFESNELDMEENGGGMGSFGDDQDEEELEPPDDLINLIHLHEPALVYCLKKRFEMDKIYTFTGPILLALNPFKNCREMYSEKIMSLYWRRGEMSSLTEGMSSSSGEEKTSHDIDNLENLPPHVFASADVAFRNMMKCISQGGGKSAKGGSGELKDQSILVSGESGAGKTVTTKLIMEYISKLSKKKGPTTSGEKKVEQNSQIEDKVRKANPVLESFGNARTIRNDNSSRFGKFIELQFKKTGSLIGACIETYLLEKVRLVHQSPGERNYHIFYELLAGASNEERDKYFLGGSVIEDYQLTSMSGTFDRRDGVEDYETYDELGKAMVTMGFSNSERNDIKGVTAALLHASNLNIVAISDDKSGIDRNCASLEAVINLLGFKADALESALCSFSIKAGRETHIRSLPKNKAEKCLEGLIKATYSAMFLLIVKKINSAITATPAQSGQRGGRSRDTGVAGFIGVLDIFGFESFEKNSFEQLCINYCNEALQQQFNLFVFKNEQEEYKREGIKWSFIKFPDNQDVLDLIDKKGCGVLAILDDQCKAPRTTDKTFAAELYKKCTSHTRFQADFLQVGALHFGVNHYAGTVDYDTKGFVQKNKDDLPREASDLLMSSSSAFVRELANIVSGGSARTAKQKQTVGSQFTLQLKELRKRIDLTSPHYVRCLKPNAELVPDCYDSSMIVDQLRCAGVLEAVRVSRVGFPQRYAHSLFVLRYRTLALKELQVASRKGARNLCSVLVKTIAEQVWAMEHPQYTESRKEPVDGSMVGIQMGKTKVFLRSRAFQQLESLRNAKMIDAAILVQSRMRVFIARSIYICVCSSIKLQTAARLFVARSSYQRMRLSVLFAQSRIRQKKATKVVHDRRCRLLVALWSQKRYQGITGRIRYHNLNRERKSTIIQTWLRQYYYYRLFRSKQRHVLVLQSSIRVHFALVELKKRKASARDMSSLKDERDSLRIENSKLRSSLEATKLKLSSGSDKAAAMVASAKISQVAEIDALKKEIKEFSSELSCVQTRARKEIEQLQVEVEEVNESAKEEISKALVLNEKLQAESSNSISLLSTEAEELRQKVDDLEHQANTYALKSAGEIAQAHLLSSKEADDLRDELSRLSSDLAEKEVALVEMEAYKGEINVLNAELEKKSQHEEETLELEEVKAEYEEKNMQQILLHKKDKKHAADKENMLLEKLNSLKATMEEVKDDAISKISATSKEEVARIEKKLEIAQYELAESRKIELESVKEKENAQKSFDELNKEKEVVVELRRKISTLEEEVEVSNQSQHNSSTVRSEVEISKLKEDNLALKQEIDFYKPRSTEETCASSLASNSSSAIEFDRVANELKRTKQELYEYREKTHELEGYHRSRSYHSSRDQDNFSHSSNHSMRHRQSSHARFSRSRSECGHSTSSGARFEEYDNDMMGRFVNGKHIHPECTPHSLRCEDEFETQFPVEISRRASSARSVVTDVTGSSSINSDASMEVTELKTKMESMEKMMLSMIKEKGASNFSPDNQVVNVESKRENTSEHLPKKKDVVVEPPGMSCAMAKFVRMFMSTDISTPTPGTI